jgi:sulfatase maturation enzyme AslB (radical SAM superfamily)
MILNRKVYALVTTECNLQCAHCYLRTLPDNYNREVFLEKLNNFEGRIVLFGGEPTLYEDRLFDIIRSNGENGVSKIASISTNLIRLNDRLLDFYKSLKGIGTSWNLSRFNEENYRIWLTNLQVLLDNSIRHTILITMTNDLIRWPIENFSKILKEIGESPLRRIQLEYCIDPSNTKEYYDTVNDWVERLYEFHPELRIFSSEKKWYFDCNEIYTLMPDGEIVNVCPNANVDFVQTQFSPECLSCERSVYCRPCRYHAHCTYPRSIDKIKEERDGESDN